MKKETEILKHRYGPMLIKALATFFTGQFGLAKPVLDVLVSFYMKPGEDAAKKQADALEAELLLDKIHQKILEQLPTLMNVEGSSVTLEAIAAEAALTLEAGFLSEAGYAFESLVENLDTPEKLPRLWASKRQYPLDRNDTDLVSYHDLLLTNTVRNLIPVLPQMPGFMQWLISNFSQQGLIVKKLEDQERKLDEEFERRYRARLFEEHNRVELFIEEPNMPGESREQTLTVAYVTLTLTRGRTGKQIVSEVSADSLLDSLEGKARRALVIGKAGSGKTTLLRWAALQTRPVSATQDQRTPVKNDLSEEREVSNARERTYSDNWRDKVPLLIRLRYWDETFPPTPNLFHRDGAPGLDAPPGWAERILRSGRGLLLLDGLDELSPATRTDALKWIQRLTLDYPANNVFLASSRPAAVEEGALEQAGFVEFEVQDLTSSGRTVFVNRWHEAVRLRLGSDADRLGKLDEKRDHLLHELDTNLSVALLASNPLLCTLLCALNRQYRDALPENMHELCASACKMLLWDRDDLVKIPEAVYPPGYQRLNKVQRLETVTRLAYAIVLSDGVVLPKSSALKSVRDALNVPRTSDNQEAEEVLKGLLERSGLVRLSGVNHVEFVHNTLRDFLAATEFAADSAYDLLVEKMDTEGPQRWEPVLLFAAATEHHRSFAQGLLRTLLEFEGLTPERLLCRQLMALKVVGRMKYRPVSELQEKADALRQQILPIDTFEKAEALAEAGDTAFDFLVWRPDMPEAEAAACIRGLARINSERAQHALQQPLKEDRRPAVLDELARHFKPEEMAAVVNILCIPSVQSRIRELHNGPTEFLPYINDLTPLSQLTELQTLGLDNTQVADLSPLSQLTQLQALWFSNTLVADLSPLSQLLELNELRFNKTQVADLSPLANLAKLHSLWLDNTPVADLSPLANLAKLQILGLDSTLVADLSPLSQLLELNELHFNKTQIDDLSPLANLAKLQTLGLDNTEVSDLSPLASLTNLQELGLNDTRVADLTPLANSTKLKAIGFDNTQVADLTPLARLAGLQTLGFNNTPVADLSPLANLTQLQTLGLDNTQVADLSPLAISAKLRLLGFNNTQVADLSILSQLAQLQALRFSNTLVADLSPLSQLLELNELRFNKTQVADLSPLANLAKLHSLWLDNTPVADLSPLANLAELKSLGFSDTRVTDLTPLTNLIRLHSLGFSGISITDLSPLAKLTELQSFQCDNTQTTELFKMISSSQLREVSLVNAPVSNLAFLIGLTRLQKLWLSNIPVADLSPLTTLSELIQLVLNNTQVVDISPLTQLTKLRGLGFLNTPVADLAPVAKLTNLRTLWLDNTPVVDLTPLAQLTELETIGLKNMQKPVDVEKFRILRRSLKLPVVRILTVFE